MLFFHKSTLLKGESYRPFSLITQLKQAPASAASPPPTTDFHSSSHHTGKSMQLFISLLSRLGFSIFSESTSSFSRPTSPAPYRRPFRSSTRTGTFPVMIPHPHHPMTTGLYVVVLRNSSTLSPRFRFSLPPSDLWRIDLGGGGGSYIAK